MYLEAALGDVHTIPNAEYGPDQLCSVPSSGSSPRTQWSWSCRPLWCPLPSSLHAMPLLPSCPATMPRLFIAQFLKCMLGSLSDLIEADHSVLIGVGFFHQPRKVHVSSEDACQAVSQGSARRDACLRPDKTPLSALCRPKLKSGWSRRSVTINRLSCSCLSSTTGFTCQGFQFHAVISMCSKLSV